MQKVSILKRILKMLRKKLNGTGICGFATLRLSVGINGLVGYKIGGTCRLRTCGQG